MECSGKVSSKPREDLGSAGKVTFLENFGNCTMTETPKRGDEKKETGPSRGRKGRSIGEDTTPTRKD